MKNLLLLALALLAGCAGMNKGSPTESRAILDRTSVAERVEVKHILLGYSWLSSRYRQMGMTLDPRAEQRNETATEQLASSLMSQLAGGAPIEPLMAQYSEDPGSARTGEAYPIDEASKFVEPFKRLALRLSPGEVGIVKSDFGYHVVKRIK